MMLAASVAVRFLKICDLTQFYSPLSGGVKRYLHEKIDYIQAHSPGDEHVLIVPGPKTENRQRTIDDLHDSFAAGFILGPVSRPSQSAGPGRDHHRERPDIIESSDPYQIGWKALACGRTLRSRSSRFIILIFQRRICAEHRDSWAETGSRAVMNFCARYVRDLYNQFEATLVPSRKLTEALSEWGVQNLREVKLGVNTDIFRPRIGGEPGMRVSLGVASDQKMLLYVGRLAQEKNTDTLLRAFAVLEQERRPGDFHLVVIGDGPGRAELQKLQKRVDPRSPGFLIVPIQPNSRAIFGRPICLFIPAFRKHSGLPHWRARLVERQSSGFVAATWMSFPRTGLLGGGK